MRSRSSRLSCENNNSVDGVDRAGLFHSKYIFEYVTTKTSETLSLSHVLEAMSAIQIKGKVSCDRPTLNESNGANTTSIFSLSDITDIMDESFPLPNSLEFFEQGVGLFQLMR